MEQNKKSSIISPWLWTAIVVVILIVAGYFVWAMWNKTQSVVASNTTSAPTIQPTAVTSPSISPSTSASSISTADWKTYTNAQYGYSIKYPSDFTYKETKDLDNLGTGSVVITFANNTDQSKTLTITAVDLSKNGSNNSKPDMLMTPNGMEPVSAIDLTIAGQPAKDYVDADGTHSYVTYKGTSWFNLLASDLTTQQLLKEMLSTFEFTK